MTFVFPHYAEISWGAAAEAAAADVALWHYHPSATFDGGDNDDGGRGRGVSHPHATWGFEEENPKVEDGERSESEMRLLPLGLPRLKSVVVYYQWQWARGASYVAPP